jgi:hypothetical protein
LSTLYTSILWFSLLIITPTYLKSVVQDLRIVASSMQEGFIADTIIKTIDGYKSIESLKLNDQVIGYGTSDQQYYSCRITAITKQCAPNSIRIITSNNVIQTGAYQKFYIAQKKNLILAKDIKPGDCLYGISGDNTLVVNVENIDTSTTLYAITVEENHFCITHSDVLVHNFDPCTASTMLILAPAANPVGATILGGVILTGALCLTLHKIWKSESNKTAIQFLHDDGDTPSIDRDLLSSVATGGSPEPPEDPNNSRKNNRKQKDIDPEKFKKSVDNGTTKNNLNHFFEKPEHCFKELLTKTNAIDNPEVQKQIVEQIIKKLFASGMLPSSGVFKDIPISLEGFIIHVRGFVDDGVIKIGTMFIPK